MELLEWWASIRFDGMGDPMTTRGGRGLSRSELARLGGVARALSLSARRRSEIARQAALVRWAKAKAGG